jgi:hypothetical protein
MRQYRWHDHGHHHHHHDYETKAERLERLEAHRRDVEEYLADLSEKIRRLQEDDARPEPADDVTAAPEPS